MIKILLIGDGAMGDELKKQAQLQNIQIVGVVGKTKQDSLASPFDAMQKADCVVDFSHPSMTQQTIDYCQKTLTPAVIATTNLSQSQLDGIKTLSNSVAVCQSSNFSIGVIALKKALKCLLTQLPDFDVEILECHHNQKADSPSGTAKSLAQTVKQARTDANFVYGRQGTTKRNKNDVGIMSLRGGTQAGTHEILFFGNDETISIKHTAQSKSIFALGALKAAKALTTLSPALYLAEDII